jgi:DNA mismatch endonuclease, patch repair protein
MRANRSEGGRAEYLLRTALWRQGLRYRKHLRALPGCPDLVFSSARVCVFCDGDFWHGRSWSELRQKLERRANAGYWIPKIARNIERDREQDEQLKTLGWTVLRFWESDVIRDRGAVVERIVSAIRRRPAGIR